MSAQITYDVQDVKAIARDGKLMLEEMIANEKKGLVVLDEVATSSNIPDLRKSHTTLSESKEGILFKDIQSVIDVLGDVEKECETMSELTGEV